MDEKRFIIKVYNLGYSRYLAGFCSATGKAILSDRSEAKTYPAHVAVVAMMNIDMDDIGFDFACLEDT